MRNGGVDGRGEAGRGSARLASAFPCSQGDVCHPHCHFHTAMDKDD